MDDDLRLYPFQVDGMDFLVSKKKSILADQMGLGKTVTATNAAVRVWPEIAKQNVLIVVPKIAIHVWLFELLRWAEWVPEVVVGHRDKRHLQWKELKEKTHEVVLTTYDIVRLDQPLLNKEWGLIIWDEAHRLRNRRTKRSKAAASLKAEYMFFLTGTPVRSGPQDLWSMLNMIKPHMFRSYWRFVNTFCLVDMTPWGREIIGTKNTENLKKLLSQFMLRRMAKDVLKDMPEIVPIPYPLEISGEQERIYKELQEESIAMLPEGDVIVSPSILSTIMRLRQLLVTPKLISDDLPYGATIEALVERIEDQEEPHATVFTPFAEALPFVQERLEQEGYEDIFTIKGAMSSKQVKEAEDAFKETRGIMLATIKAAEAYSLETCSYGYFVGFEWDYDENDQAARRLLRMTSQDNVFMTYFVHEDLMDERVLEVVLGKRQNVYGSGSIQKVMEQPGLLKYLLL